MANTGVWVTVSLIILVLVGGFFLFNSAFNSSDKEEYQGLVVVEKSDSQEDPSSSEETSIEGPSSEETLIEGSEQIVKLEEVAETKEFNIIAKQWDFSPSTITVNEGDNVILNIESIDVTHGFSLLSFGVSEQLVSGNIVEIEFTADKKGTFSFFCNVQCGSGHIGMKGTLVVQ